MTEGSDPHHRQPVDNSRGPLATSGGIPRMVVLDERNEIARPMPKYFEKESWKHQLTDLALGLGFAGIIAIEVLYGVPHPWLILIAGILLMPLVGLHTIRLMIALSKEGFLTWIEHLRFSIPVFLAGQQPSGYCSLPKRLRLRSSMHVPSLFRCSF